MKKLNVCTPKIFNPYFFAHILKDIIPPNTNFAKLFLDLLKKIFVYDPAQRITAKQALQHPWFKELAIADDGSEAARIKREREEEQAEARRANGYR